MSLRRFFAVLLFFCAPSVLLPQFREPVTVVDVSPTEGATCNSRTDRAVIRAMDTGAVFKCPTGVDKWVRVDRAEYNVKDFGALGDGSNNDTSSIQAAIDAAKVYGPGSTVGTVVYFPPGNYIITSPLILPRSGATPNNIVHLDGAQDFSSKITGDSSFPTNRALIEWEAVDTRSHGMSIRNLFLQLPQVSGVMGINYVPTDKSTGVSIRDETLQDMHMENIHIKGHNDYHTRFIYLEGNLKFGKFENIVGDATVGSGTSDIYLFEFDTTPFNYMGLDEAGCNFCYFENVSAGFRAGGRIAVVKGRLNQCTMDRVMAGIRLKSLPYMDLTNSSSVLVDGFLMEGGGSQPFVKLTNSQRNHFRAFAFGHPVDTGGGGTGNVVELYSDSDWNIFEHRTDYPESARFHTPTASDVFVFDATSDYNVVRNLSLAEGTDIDEVFSDLGTENSVEIWDEDNEGYTVYGRQRVEVFQQHVNVKDFGAKGDGTTDDTAAIRRAMDETGTRPVFFPTGTYIVSPTTPNVGVIGLNGGREVFGEGIGKSIIKVKDSSSEYEHLLSGDHTVLTPTTDMTGTTIRDLTFDHNILNNGFTTDPITNDNGQVTIMLPVGSDLTVKDCEFKNASSVWMIGVSNATGERILIENNRFVNVGDNPDDFYHDASMIYVNAYDVVIRNNFFESAGLPTVPEPTGCDVSCGARTAIETHGPMFVVAGNVINEFQIGMNITGVDTEDNYGTLVTGNTINNSAHGIQLWSNQNQSHTTGYGFLNLIVDSNVINSAETGVWVESVGVSGIRLVSSIDLDSKNITISNNNILFPLEGSLISTGSFGGGIMLRDSSVAASRQKLDNLLITGNTVENSPLPGIRVDMGMENVKIVDNVLRNTGSTLDTVSIPLLNRPAILIDGAGAIMENVEISNNLILDDIATTRIGYGITLRDNSTAGDSGVVVQDNIIRVTGDQGTFVEPIYLDGNITPLLKGNKVEPYDPPGNVAMEGSTMYDIENERWYYQEEATTTWSQDLSFGTGTAADQTITFDTDTNETIMWDDSEDRFAVSADFYTEGRFESASGDNLVHFSTGDQVSTDVSMLFGSRNMLAYTAMRPDVTIACDDGDIHVSPTQGCYVCVSGNGVCTVSDPDLSTRTAVIRVERFKPGGLDTYIWASVSAYFANITFRGSQYDYARDITIEAKYDNNNPDSDGCGDLGDSCTWKTIATWTDDTELQRTAAVSFPDAVADATVYAVRWTLTDWAIADGNTDSYFFHLGLFHKNEELFPQYLPRYDVLDRWCMLDEINWCDSDGNKYGITWDANNNEFDFDGDLNVAGDVLANNISLGRYESVEDYGADGSDAVDDTTEIQNAINAVEAYGGTLYFPDGTYLISSTLGLTNRITLRGAGVGDEAGADKAASIIKKDADVLAILVEDGANYTVIEDLAVQGSGTDTTNGINIGEVSDQNGANHVVLRNVVVTDVGGVGVDILNGNVGTLDNVKAISNGSHGIRIASQHTIATNTNSWVLTNAGGGSNGGDGLVIDPGHDNSVIGGSFESNTGRGVYVNESRNFIRTYAENNTGYDIEAGSSADNSTIMTRSGDEDTKVNIASPNKVNFIDQASGGSGLALVARPDRKVLVRADTPDGTSLAYAGLMLAGQNAVFDTWEHGMIQKSFDVSLVATTQEFTQTLKQGSIIDNIWVVVETDVTGITSFSVGDPTTPDRFIKESTAMTAGNKTNGMRHWGHMHDSAEGPLITGGTTNIRFTYNGGTPTAGRMRFVVYYRQPTLDEVGANMDYRADTEEMDFGGDLEFGDGSSDVIATFDSTADETLKWRDSAGFFEFSDQLSVADTYFKLGKVFDEDLSIVFDIADSPDPIFMWDEDPGQFDVNYGFRAHGNVRADGPTLTIGDDTDEDLYLSFDVNSSSESLQLNWTGGSDFQFELSDDLVVSDDVTVQGELLATTGGNEINMQVGDNGTDDWVLGNSRNILAFISERPDVTVDADNGDIAGTNCHRSTWAESFGTNCSATVAAVGNSLVIEFESTTTPFPSEIFSSGTSWFSSVQMRDSSVPIPGTITFEAKYDDDCVGQPGCLVWRQLGQITSNTDTMIIHDHGLPPSIAADYDFYAWRVTLDDWNTTGTTYIPQMGFHHRSEGMYPHYLVRYDDQDRYPMLDEINWADETGTLYGINWDTSNDEFDVDGTINTAGSLIVGDIDTCDAAINASGQLICDATPTGMPGSSTDEAIVRWDGTLADTLQDYTATAPTIDDTGGTITINNTDADLVVVGDLDTINESAAIKTCSGGTNSGNHCVEDFQCPSSSCGTTVVAANLYDSKSASVNHAGFYARNRGGNREERPIVVLTMDDASETQFTDAWPILKARDLPATFFISTNKWNTAPGYVMGDTCAPNAKCDCEATGGGGDNNDECRITEAQARQWALEGADLQSHGDGELAVLAMCSGNVGCSYDDYVLSDWDNNHDWFQENLGRRPSVYGAPGGNWDWKWSMKAALWFDGVRQGASGYSVPQGLMSNEHGGSRFVGSGWFADSSSHTAENLCDFIRAAVVPTPDAVWVTGWHGFTDGSTITTNEYPISEFTEFADCLQDLRDTGQIDVLTYPEMLNRRKRTRGRFNKLINPGFGDVAKSTTAVPYWSDGGVTFADNADASAHGTREARYTQNSTQNIEVLTQDIGGLTPGKRYVFAVDVEWDTFSATATERELLLEVWDWSGSGWTATQHNLPGKILSREWNGTVCEKVAGIDANSLCDANSDCTDHASCTGGTCDCTDDGGAGFRDVAYIDFRAPSPNITVKIKVSNCAVASCGQQWVFRYPRLFEAEVLGGTDTYAQQLDYTGLNYFKLEWKMNGGSAISTNTERNEDVDVLEHYATANCGGSCKNITVFGPGPTKFLITRIEVNPGSSTLYDFQLYGRSGDQVGTKFFEVTGKTATYDTQTQTLDDGFAVLVQDNSGPGEYWSTAEGPAADSGNQFHARFYNDDDSNTAVVTVMIEGFVVN